MHLLVANMQRKFIYNNIYCIYTFVKISMLYF